MRVFLAMCVFGGGLMLSVGCASTGHSAHAPSAADRARWVAGRGGVERCAARESVLATLCEQLLVAAEPEPTPLRLRVLRHGPPRAYAFPPDAVYVTASAFARWPEDELAAAVAHELGHLLDEPTASASPVALVADATPAHLAIEMRADRIGRGLLRDAGRDPAALSRLLSRLATDARTPAETRAHLTRRLDVLALREVRAAGR